jgi:glycosyltransferase involved in cell wall biosynthesis
MKIAIVHDYFTQLGGAERVAEELVRMLPGAALHSTVALPDRLPPGLVGVPITTSWMQRLPGMSQHYRLYFLLYPLAVPSLDLSGYDLVLSSSSGYAKGVHTNRDAVHVCYCHTPMRWAWSFENYSAREEMGAAKRLLLPHLVRGLRRWDLGASRQPDHFIANSHTVAARIRRAYGRLAEVIHPPIDLGRFRPVPEQDDYYIVLARLVSYKQIDLAVQACTLLGRRLLVIGDGPDRARLMANAGKTVSFLGHLSDAEVEQYAARCRALIFPGEEDFGMAPLEIASAGRPTIAYRAGGAVETIVEGLTGIFFDRPEVGELAAAIKRFERMEWSAAALRSHAENFGIDVFQSRMRAFLAKVGAPVPEPELFPFNAASRTATADLGIPVQAGIPA